MYFEVVECVRKLLLTGMLTFCFPETPCQARARALVLVVSHSRAD